MIAQFLMCFMALPLATIVDADVYMHTLRGSNNRLDEPTQDRDTNNRIFDSQNNNKGGYNVGDRTAEKANNNKDAETIYSRQYNMEYFMSSRNAASKLRIEWTNQHGCGGDENTNPHKLNCNLVLQFMCQPDVDTTGPDTIRNGVNRKQNDYEKVGNNENTQAFQKRKEKNNKYGQDNAKKDSRGMHERFEWYDKCAQRSRNKGLFTADQNMKNKDKAVNTRQNNNGNRNGYECPEERDYYPYWHPTPWKDVVVFGGSERLQEFCTYYKDESFNTASKWECVEKPKHYSSHNNKKDCEDGGGEWLEFHNYLEKSSEKTESACKAKGFKWARPLYGYDKECLVPLEKPDCKAAPWTRVNHLGNGATGDLQTPFYDWELPHFPSGDAQRCVFRIRYNISTDDYDPWNTDWRFNGDRGYTLVSTDPKVDVGASNVELQLNINTAQFGRTFQDRSHVFKIKSRPPGALTQTIHNLNVRGKRGNIVQAFPAVEYDFTPTDLEIKSGDLVHAQWTGSNSHNNGGGGDGQKGDAGEGTGGTDRNNCVPMVDRNHNFPMLSSTKNLFTDAEVIWSALNKEYVGYNLKYEDVYVQHASSGYYVCGLCSSPKSLKNLGKTKAMDGKLNNAPASFGGMLLKFTKRGTYHYMCTRNNNFSNRSQKGSLIVK